MQVKTPSWKLPIQILKDQYVSLFGGWSEELGDNEMGLNKVSLSRTDIQPYTTKITLRKFDSKTRLPLFFKDWFEVIPLGREMPDAYSKSLTGEVVLPESELEKKEFSLLRRGDLLVMNNVLGDKLENPMEWNQKVLEKILSEFSGGASGSNFF